MIPPRLIFDAHLDISMNAMEFNRDQRMTLEEIRRSELLTSDGLPHRCRNTVCFPELRRGRIGIIVATQIARYSHKFHKLPGWRSPEQAWAMLFWVALALPEIWRVLETSWLVRKI